MYIPQKGSIRERIALLLNEVGEKTSIELRRAFPDVRGDSITEAITDMRQRGAIVCKGRTLVIAPSLANFYSGCDVETEEYAGTVAGPRYNPGFRPLSTKNMPHLAPRREPIREDFSCKAASSSVPFSWSW